MRQPRARPAETVPGQARRLHPLICMLGQEDTNLAGIRIPMVDITAQNTASSLQLGHRKHVVPAFNACFCRRSTSRVSVSSAWCCWALSTPAG